MVDKKKSIAKPGHFRMAYKKLRFWAEFFIVKLMNVEHAVLSLQQIGMHYNV